MSKNIEYEKISMLDLPWEKLRDKSFLIVGATGLVGKTLTELLVCLNHLYGNRTKIYAMGRSSDTAKERLGDFISSEEVQFIPHDISKPFETNKEFDYIVHAASNTHPQAYTTDPVGTITTNIYGTHNLLEYVKDKPNCRLLFLSSVEVYGENRGDAEKFDENYCGYIDCNTLRAGYPESKRLSETLCQAYETKYGADMVIARLGRVYGADMLSSDTKSTTQFLRNAVNGKDIVLKSKGEQRYSCVSVFDAVSALLYILLLGTCGEAYNVCDDDSVTLFAIANVVAEQAGVRVVFDLPSETEKIGSCKVQIALMTNSKLKKMGWKPTVGTLEGFTRTLSIMQIRG